MESFGPSECHAVRAFAAAICTVAAATMVLAILDKTSGAHAATANMTSFSGIGVQARLLMAVITVSTCNRMLTATCPSAKPKIEIEPAYD
jgi:hypothetical protein